MAIAAGDNYALGYTVGLKADGTVKVACYQKEVANIVNSWTDIIAISANGPCIVGLKSNGTVVAAYAYEDCDKDGSWIVHGSVKGVERWKLFNSIDTLEQELIEIEMEKEAERQEQIADIKAECSNLQAKLPNVKGLFSGTIRREIESRLAQIEEELSRL